MSDSAGKRLEKARTSAGYETAADACDAFGWTYSTYAGHENGSRGFARHATRYARAYQVRIDWLLAGRGEMKGASSPEEAEVIDIWGRILDPQEREAWLNMGRVIAKEKEK